MASISFLSFSCASSAHAGLQLAGDTWLSSSVSIPRVRFHELDFDKSLKTNVALIAKIWLSPKTTKPKSLR